MSDSLQPHGPQHARPPCPSPTPGVHSNSRPLSRWCHPAVSSSVVPFSSCLQSFPASGPFPISHFFTSGGQSIGFSFSVNPSSEYLWLISFRVDWFDLAVQGNEPGLSKWDRIGVLQTSTLRNQGHFLSLFFFQITLCAHVNLCTIYPFISDLSLCLHASDIRIFLAKAFLKSHSSLHNCSRGRLCFFFSLKKLSQMHF